LHHNGLLEEQDISRCRNILDLNRDLNTVLGSYLKGELSALQVKGYVFDCSYNTSVCVDDLFANDPFAGQRCFHVQVNSLMA